MTAQITCHSCTMPIESGTLCPHCADDTGQLRPFAELFERMVQWTQSQDSELARADAERQTLDFMAKMPAWRGHAELRARRG